MKQHHDLWGSLIYMWCGSLTTIKVTSQLWDSLTFVRQTHNWWGCLASVEPAHNWWTASQVAREPQDSWCCIITLRQPHKFHANLENTTIKTIFCGLIIHFSYLYTLKYSIKQIIHLRICAFRRFAYCDWGTMLGLKIVPLEPKGIFSCLLWQENLSCDRKFVTEL